MKRTATIAELAYCAGVIDSDGTIGIKRSTYGMRVRGDSSQATYSERIKVKQVESQAVDLLHDIFGGSFRIEAASLKSGRPLFAWHVTDLQCTSVCLALLPFLRIKKRQAENVLALRSVKEASRVQRWKRPKGQIGASRRAVEHTEAMDATYVIAKELNRVGI
jgi:hypothetical protein